MKGKSGTAEKWKSKILTRSEVAAVMGVTPMRITKWSAMGMPVAFRGGRGVESKYNLDAVLAWREQQEKLVVGGGDAAPSGSALNLGEERARLARAQTAKTMLDIAKRRRDLLPRDEVVRDGKAVIGAVRAKLLAMPSRLVQMGIVEAANRPRLEAYLHEAMEEMSRWKTRLELLEHQ